jgi:hypothetical protein
LNLFFFISCFLVWRLSLKTAHNLIQSTLCDDSCPNLNQNIFQMYFVTRREKKWNNLKFIYWEIAVNLFVNILPLQEIKIWLFVKEKEICRISSSISGVFYLTVINFFLIWQNDGYAYNRILYFVTLNHTFWENADCISREWFMNLL